MLNVHILGSKNSISLKTEISFFSLVCNVYVFRFLDFTIVVFGLIYRREINTVEINGGTV